MKFHILSWKEELHKYLSKYLYSYGGQSLIDIYVGLKNTISPHRWWNPSTTVHERTPLYPLWLWWRSKSLHWNSWIPWRFSSRVYHRLHKESYGDWTLWTCSGKINIEFWRNRNYLSKWSLSLLTCRNFTFFFKLFI